MSKSPCGSENPLVNKRLISIIIPAKDEAETLPRLLSDLWRVIEKIPGYEFELLVVNDHSKDRTTEAAQAGRARVIENQRTPGKGHALISGFEQAGGDIFITMDADYSHQPEDIPNFLSKLQEGHSLVVGSRSTGGSDEYTVIRTLGNVGLSAVFRALTGVKTTDVLNGYKAFRREVFARHRYHSSQFEIEIELMINTLREGWSIGEFACHERARAAGKAKSHIIPHGFRFLWKIVQLGMAYRLERFLRWSKHG